MDLRKIAFSALLIVGVSVVLAPASTSLGFAQSLPGQPMPPKDYLLSRLNANMTLDAYLKRMRGEFRMADADADGEISQSDAVLLVQIRSALWRSTILAQFLPADLNGDGVVTEDELRSYLRYGHYSSEARPAAGKTVDETIEDQIRQIMAADADHDGRITFAEELNYANSLPNPGAFAANSVYQLMALAPEGKSVLTRADFEAAVEKLFHEVDADGNGTVSVDELKNYRAQGGESNSPNPQTHGEAAPAPPQRNDAQVTPDQARAQRDAQAAAMQQRADAQRAAVMQQRAQKEAELRAACSMPKASDAAKVVLVSGYEPEALSSVTIGSQDVAVSAGNIHVEPGNEPIYLVVVSFRPTIWRFSGAVGRIERLVLTTSRPERVGELPQDKPIVGATNIPADRITFLPPAKCISHFIEAPSGGAASAAAAVKREAGKDVTTLSALYSFSDVAVPSGRMRSLRGANAGKMTVIKQSAGTLKIIGSSRNIVVEAGAVGPVTNLKRFTPGGVIEIDPRGVVASLPVERYQVLPEEAGLIQLMRAGKIAQDRGGEYLIKKKIRFPADLTGAHSVKFLLLRGVPSPDGDSGHSEVISEETGKEI